MTELYHDTERNLLVYRSSDRIAQWVPEARAVNGAYVAVPRTLHNLQILRHLDLPVVPIMDGYDWPRAPGIKPLDHQKVMANFMVMHPHCFNLSDMGTMKTLATLWAADWLMSQHARGHFRALVVCPLSILQRVWGDAIFKNLLGRRTFRIVHGSAEKRERELAEPADFYIINFDGVGVGARTRGRFDLDGLSKSLAGRDDIRLCIIDEGSAYKDSRTKRHRIARMVLGQRPYLWLLTGTPTPNGPEDAYGLARLVNPEYREGFVSYKRRVMTQVSAFKWVPRSTGNEDARRLLQPAIRYDIRDVWDGPELTTQQREVELTVQQVKLLKGLKRDLQVVVEQGPITVANEAAARTKYLQISLGAVYDGQHAAHAVDASPRIRELKDVINNASGKLLIFAPLTSIVDMLNRELKEWTREVINGATPQRKRSDVFRSFQQSADPRLLIADPGTMAHGLDLYAARTVVWYGPTEKTELYLQANKRAHRPGQKYPVTVVQLVSNKLEREIFTRLESNRSLQGLLLEMVRKGDL